MTHRLWVIAYDSKAIGSVLIGINLYKVKKAFVTQPEIFKCYLNITVDKLTGNFTGLDQTICCI